jgi:hypothetical protein
VGTVASPFRSLQNAHPTNRVSCASPVGCRKQIERVNLECIEVLRSLELAILTAGKGEPRSAVTIDDAETVAGGLHGAPEGTRTPNLRLRRPALYPIELRARYSSSVHTELNLINPAVRGERG